MVEADRALEGQRLTAKEYAAELGFNAHSLSWWKWRLVEAGPAELEIFTLGVGRAPAGGDERRAM